MLVRRLVLLAAIPAAILAPQLTAQTPNQPLKFEVASIRPHQGPLRVIAGFTPAGPRVTMEGYNLRLLVQEAYNIKRYQLSFAGSNLGEDEDSNTYYNITANAPEGTNPTRDEFRQMLRALLADRFHLRVHTQAKEMPVYALIIAKNGPKLTPSAPDAVHHTLVTGNGRNQGPITTKGTIPELIDIIMGGLGPRLPIIDKTGLTGFYDYSFEATPEYRINNNPQPDDVSLFDVLQDKLGLKLETEKANIEITLIDHIEKPTEN